MQRLIICLIVILSFYVEVFAQKTENIKSIFSDDPELQIVRLKEKIKDNKDAASNYELAKILSNKKTHFSLTDAIQYSRRAVELDDKNISYRLLLARIREDLFYAARMNVEERKAAMMEYEKIIELDSNCAAAFYNLGRLEGEDFLKLQHASLKSIINKSKSPEEMHSIFRGKNSLLYESQAAFDNTIGNFTESLYSSEARATLRSSEKHLMHATKTETFSEESKQELSKLYLADKNFTGIIQLLEPDIVNKSNNKVIHLYLALAYYYSKYYQQASREFDKAISLMSEEEKSDYNINSIKLFLSERIGKPIEEIKSTELPFYIQKYWAVNDPLNLTHYNERQLEHYSRVTYANIYFASKKLKNIGWKTNQGEILIRYGQPNKIIRYVSETQGANFSNKPRTEVWEYPDKQFAFVDLMRNDNYEFAQPWNGMVPMNTHEELINLRKTKPEEYFPLFDGPIFSLDYKTYQFASYSNTFTDIWVSYKINYSDTASEKDKFINGCVTGLFLYDNSFIKVAEQKIMTTPDLSTDYSINTIGLTAAPVKGNLSFEMIRNMDRGVAAYHGKFLVRKFKKDDLDISDLVLATKVNPEGEIQGALRRNNVSLVPNPSKQFTNGNDLFIYYELYNLERDQNKLTDFVQSVSIISKEEGLFNTIATIVGLNKDGKRISLASSYRTQEKDPQIYLQLDMSKYEPGNYIIAVTIKDKLSGKSVSADSEIIWQ